MSIDWVRLAKEHLDNLPSPHNPNLLNKDYAVAVKLATMTKFGSGEGHASPKEAELFWHEFKQTGLSPKQYEESLNRMAPVSFALHGRPPSMDEIVKLKDEHPEAVSKYYGALPDKHYPAVPAAAMVKHLAEAHVPWMQALGRPPTKLEASMLYHSRESVSTFAQRLAPPKEVDASVSQDGSGNDSGGSGVAASGGSPADQRDRSDRGPGLREG